jgi:hypothetical protein
LGNRNQLSLQRPVRRLDHSPSDYAAADLNRDYRIINFNDRNFVNLNHVHDCYQYSIDDLLRYHEQSSSYPDDIGY